MTGFPSIEALHQACQELPVQDEAAAAAACAHQNTLTKPRGSLGRLEELAVWLAGWQGKAGPELNQVDVLVFAGSHGVTARGVSAFPAEVTGQMVANFETGGAAINQLARQSGANLRVMPLCIDRPTADFCESAAMPEQKFLEAVTCGYESVSKHADLVCLGEMGIGNTTSAAAICANLFGGGGRDWVGRGTGVDDEGLAKKAEAVDMSLKTHAGVSGDPLRILAAVGGRELAAMFGAVLAARRRRIPVLLDGFVCTAAVAPLAAVAAGGLDHVKCSHRSAEQAHHNLLERLSLEPVLDLGMRLGEASGACLAVNILRAALACHNGMASFAEAGVTDNEP